MYLALSPARLTPDWHPEAGLYKVADYIVADYPIVLTNFFTITCDNPEPWSATFHVWRTSKKLPKLPPLVHKSPMNPGLGGNEPKCFIGLGN
jgi:hypothetical protein